MTPNTKESIHLRKNIFIFKMITRTFSQMKLSRFDRSKTESRYSMHKTGFSKTLNQDISLKKKSIHLEKSKFIFYAVKDIFTKHVKNIFGKLVLALITWSRVKRWVI